MKKTLLIIFLFLVIVSVVKAASLDEHCTVKSSCGVGEFAIFSISDSGGNAHVEETPTLYSDVVCCEGDALNNNCAQGDVILQLTDSDNAHIFGPDYSGPHILFNEVCLGTDDGTTVECDTVGGAGYWCVVSISDTENAHVGPCGVYPNNVFCKVGGGASPCTLTEAKWCPSPIWDATCYDVDTVANDGDTLYMFVSGDPVTCSGETASFTVLEIDDEVGGLSDVVPGSSATDVFDASGIAYAPWDVIYAPGDEDDPPFEDAEYKIRAEVSDFVLSVEQILVSPAGQPCTDLGGVDCCDFAAGEYCPPPGVSFSGSYDCLPPDICCSVGCQTGPAFCTFSFPDDCNLNTECYDTGASGEICVWEADQAGVFAIGGECEGPPSCDCACELDNNVTMTCYGTECVDDRNGDDFGLYDLRCLFYNSSEVLYKDETYPNLECVLEGQAAPFYGAFSILLTLILLIGYYFFEKKKV